MKWDKYTIDTTTEAEDFISMMLSENGIEGIEIEDNVPLKKQEKCLLIFRRSFHQTKVKAKSAFI